VVEGNKHFDDANIRASVPALALGTAPNITRIARGLNLANENPAKEATVLLRSAEREGTVDAVVRVVDEDWLKFALTLDNTGINETGELRVGLGLENANVLDRDHVLNLQYVGAPYLNSTNDQGEPSQLSIKPSNRVLIVGAGYHVPLYALCDSLDFIAGYSDVDSAPCRVCLTSPAQAPFSRAAVRAAWMPSTITRIAWFSRSTTAPTTTAACRSRVPACSSFRTSPCIRGA